DNKDIAEDWGVIEALASDIHQAGGIGSAQLMRASYILQMSAAITSAIESEALYRGLAEAKTTSRGIDLDVHLSAGTIAPQAKSVLEAIERGDFEGQYSAEMLMSDISAALTTADECEVSLPIAEAAFSLLELLCMVGGADKGVSAINLLYETEDKSVAQGLDWSLAEQYDHEHGDDCDCGHHHHHHDEDDDEEYELDNRSFGFDDEFGFADDDEFGFDEDDEDDSDRRLSQIQ
ncbi:MAG: hypothetical protein J6Y65_03490, partial [Eggerthellaceae bacterium]|nr:hypothetical protein [Eggerthellaceae bacterium]